MRAKNGEPIRWGDIPPVLSAIALLDKAFKKAAKAKKRGRSRLERTRSESISRIRALGDSLASSLDSCVRSFPSLDRLSPFYRDLVDILVDADSVKHDLGALGWCRGKVLQFSKAYAAEIGRLQEATVILRRRKEAYGRISSLVMQISENLESLEAARRRLSDLPSIDLSMPTIVVAGIANVGKSQFVSISTSARPKVAHYPFTTKELSVGHTERGRLRLQIIDTPGLLDRPAEKRNPIEQQAANALRHLAKAVVFLLDPTETCGFTMSEQLHLLSRLRDEFPDVQFIEVENKLDLLDSKSNRMKVSALTGQGVDKVIDGIVAILTSRAPASSLPRRAE